MCILSKPILRLCFAFGYQAVFRKALPEGLCLAIHLVRGPCRIETSV